MTLLENSCVVVDWWSVQKGERQDSFRKRKSSFLKLLVAKSTLQNYAFNFILLN